MMLVKFKPAQTKLLVAIELLFQLGLVVKSKIIFKLLIIELLPKYVVLLTGLISSLIVNNP